MESPEEVQKDLCNIKDEILNSDDNEHTNSKILGPGEVTHILFLPVSQGHPVLKPQESLLVKFQPEPDPPISYPCIYIRVLIIFVSYCKSLISLLTFSREHLLDIL